MAAAHAGRGKPDFRNWTRTPTLPVLLAKFGEHEAGKNLFIRFPRFVARASRLGRDPINVQREAAGGFIPQ